MQTIRTAEKAEKLLTALREKPSVAAACRKARVSRAAFYEWRRDEPDFAARVEAALSEGMQAVEDALVERAIKMDTTAAIFLLKAHNPAKYRETTRLEHTGADGAPIRFVYQEYVPNPPEDGG